MGLFQLLNVNNGIKSINDQIPIFNIKLKKVIEYGLDKTNLDRPKVTIVVKISPRTPQSAP
jgi:hypothetical protein